MLSIGGGIPIRFRGDAKSICPGGGLLYAFTGGIAGVCSMSDCIDDGGGGGVACLDDDFSRNCVGEGGVLRAADRSLGSVVAGGFGRASRGGGTIGGGNLPFSAIVGEEVVV